MVFNTVLCLIPSVLTVSIYSCDTKNIQILNPPLLNSIVAAKQDSNDDEAPKIKSPLRKMQYIKLLTQKLSLTMIRSANY